MEYLAREGDIVTLAGSNLNFSVQTSGESLNHRVSPKAQCKFSWSNLFILISLFIFTIQNESLCIEANLTCILFTRFMAAVRVLR